MQLTPLKIWKKAGFSIRSDSAIVKTSHQNGNYRWKKVKAQNEHDKNKRRWVWWDMDILAVFPPIVLHLIKKDLCRSLLYDNFVMKATLMDVIIPTRSKLYSKGFLNSRSLSLEWAWIMDALLQKTTFSRIANTLEAGRLQTLTISSCDEVQLVDVWNIT